MLDFIKQLFHNREKKLTFLLFEEDAQESSSTYHFQPQKLWWLWGVSIAVTAIGVMLLVMVTPMGNVIYDRQDALLRERVIDVSQKVMALQDSLRIRDAQLLEMQRVITSGDTTFAIEEGMNLSSPPRHPNGELNLFSEVEGIPEVSANEIIFSETFRNVPDFPAEYPVEGTLTRGFDADKGHYGIDIATQAGTSFKVLADGVVINQEWTVNYGYVIHVQHNGGFISIYKHVSSLGNTIGDIVLRGDIMGTTGDTGIMSSGSHLHVELWKNGIPQNPNTYLIKS